MAEKLKETHVFITADRYLIQNAGFKYWVLFTGKKDTMRSKNSLSLI
jgi:hypothetical protein